MHGHLGMVMPQAEYLAMAGNANAYVAPPHPGPHPVHAANATNAQIATANQQHNTALEEFKTHQAVHEAIRGQILAAVDNTFTQALEHDVIGYAGVEARTILDHLDRWYAELMDEDKENNRDLLKVAWNPDLPIEHLWKRIKDVRTIDMGLTDGKVITLTLRAFTLAGVYEDDLRLWCRKVPNEQTWANFVAHFQTSEKEQQRQLTA